MTTGLRESTDRHGHMYEPFVPSGPTRGMSVVLIKLIKVGDIGMIPSENLRETFVEFAKENKLFDRSSEISKLNEKIAYTLATYEIRTENGTPKNKKDLQGLSISKFWKF